MSAPTTRVGTWNVWWRFGDWAARQAAIERTLRAAHLDVVALQEAWAQPGRVQAHELGRRLDRHVAWASSDAPERWRARLGPGGDDLDVGVAVLSRWPIVDARVRTLPLAEMPAVEVVVEHPCGPLRVVAVHLDPQPDGTAVRALQLREVARALGERPDGELPPIVLGDLNAEPESDEVRAVCGHLTPPLEPGLVLLDAWRFAAPADPGLTWDRANPHVAAHPFPSARIDYVLLGADAQGPRVHRVARFADAALDGCWASDHAGVLAELEFAPVAATPEDAVPAGHAEGTRSSAPRPTARPRSVRVPATTTPDPPRALAGLP